MLGPLQPIHDLLGPTLFYYAFSPALKIAALLFLIILPLITYLVLAERKILGFMQVRLGPNRVGPWGLLQPIADVMKLLVKEDVMPSRAVKWAFILAPCLVVGPAFVIFSVIPFGTRSMKSLASIRNSTPSTESPAEAKSCLNARS